MALGSFFNSRRSKVVVSAPQRAEAPASASDRDNRLSYPPVDPGIPLRSIDDILLAHDDLIRRIKLSYGADHDTFASDLVTLMQRYAQYVNLLPATPDNYFSSPGGLFRMGLEIAFYSLQATDGQIFSGRATITNRRQLEPRWRHATFIAGLCSELHRTLSHVRVTDDNGHEWPSYLVPLTDWLQERHTARFFLRWIPNAQETRSLGVFAIPKIIPTETLHHLAKGNAIVVPHMMASISGMPVFRESNILDQLVRRATALVIDRDLQASADRYGKPQLGTHLERYLVDALRQLIASNIGWLPNADRSRVWYGQDGLYIVWPNAMTEVSKLLDADQLPGIPKVPETIVEILIDAGVIEPRGDSQTTWLIFPPDAKTSIEAIKLVSPAILLAAFAATPDPLPYSLLTPRPVSSATASAKPASTRKKPADRQLPLLALPDPTTERDPAAPQSAVAEKPSIGASRDTDSQAELWQPGSIPALSPVFSLSASMRLNPVLRAGLEEIIETLNKDAAGLACCSVSTGLFVPLEELERRHIDTSIAVRALFDLSMLVLHSSDMHKTTTHDFGEEKKLGIVIAPQFIAGFDPADFVPPSASGGSHAGS